MAVHVVQGKDPWWAPLAVNVLGGLYNDWQQRERNKKEAAFLGELARLGAGTQDNTAPAPAQDAGQGLLSMGAADNADGWTNALHKTENPLLQFDIGTAGLAPKAPAVNTPAPTNAWANALGNAGSQLGQFDANTAGIVPATPAQSTTRAPMVTPMDWYNAAMQLAGTKRFRMISPDRVQALLTPYMKVNEEARKEQMRNELADEIAGAADSAGRVNSATRGAVRGIIPESMLNTIYNQNKANPFTLNTGGQTLLGSTDSMSGKPTFFEAVNNTLTPAQALDDQFRRLQHEALVAQNQAQMDYNYANLRQTGEIERQRLANADRQTYIIRAGGDGKLYWVDSRNQTISPVMNGDVHMDALPSEVTGDNRFKFDAYDEWYVKNNNYKVDDLQAEIKALEARRKNAVGDELTEINNRIAAYNGEIRKIRKDTEEYVARRRAEWGNPSRGGQTQPANNNDTSRLGTGMDIGANMLGVRTPTITTHYGTKRTKSNGQTYSHNATDYAMARDTPIRLDDIGTAMKVTKVANDPKGYGNYVVAEGELTGADGKKHTISILWAHMGDGAVNVKQGQELRFGDLIGKVGNTGNSRGKNGGYHLHLETKIDGKHVDPTKFKELIAPYVAHTKTTPSNTFTGVTPPPKVTVIGREKETTVAYRNPKTGDEVSQADVEEMERRAEAGKLGETKSKEEVHKNFANEGYIHVGNGNSQNTQGQTISNDTTFPIVEQSTARTLPKVAPLDWRPSYMRVNLPSVAINPNINALGGHDIPASQGGIAVDVDNEARTEEALEQLNGQFNTWDNSFRNRYPLGSMSDFWRV